MDSFKAVFDHQLKNFFLSIGTTAEICLFRDTVSDKDKADVELILAASNLGVDVCYDQQGVINPNPNNLNHLGLLTDPTLHLVLRDITADCYQPKQSPTCVYEMLKNVCASQVRLLNEPEERVVLLDSNVANHIVNNGVSNAAKYGSQEKKATCAFELSSTELVVIIENEKGDCEQHSSLQSACGQRGRIYFSEDRSTSLPRASKSSGFGSTIIYRCTRLMGGTCYLQVSPTSTKFVLKVPIKCVAPVNPATPAEVAQCPLIPVPTTLKFAVIDDHALVARVCTKQIKELFGCECQWLQPEGSLAEMIACVENLQPDILLVDNDLGTFGTGDKVLTRLQQLTCSFNGVAISYSGDQTSYEPCILKSTRGRNLALMVQQIWSSFVYGKKLAGKRVLLVDDKDLHVHLETKMLNKERAVVTRLTDGSELLAALEQHTGKESDGWSWDAVVLDQTMATLDGLPTLERLPERFKTEVPIVLYSTEDSLQERYLAAGATCYVEKRPGSHKTILEVLTRLLVQLQ